MRLSSKSIVDTALTGLGGNYQRLAELQRQMASGRRISRLSDDPATMAQSLGHRSDLESETQYIRNIDSSLARIGVTESNFSQMSDLLQRAREIAVYGSNSTISPEMKNNMAAEVRQLIDQAVQVGNTKFNGQYLFAGTATTTVPFTVVGNPPTSVTYNGNAGLIDRQIDTNARVAVNVPGNTALGDSFTALIGLHTRLTTPGADASLSLGDFDTAMNTVLQQRGQFGAKVDRFERTRFEKEETQLQKKSLISAAEDIDVVETITKLKAQEATYEAALMSTARVIQPSLLQFLR